MKLFPHTLLIVSLFVDFWNVSLFVSGNLDETDMPSPMTGSEAPSQTSNNSTDSDMSAIPTAEPTPYENTTDTTIVTSISPTMALSISMSPSLSPNDDTEDTNSTDSTISGIPTVMPSLAPSQHKPHHATMPPIHSFPPQHKHSKPPHHDFNEKDSEDNFEDLKVPAFLLVGVLVLSVVFCVVQRVQRYRSFHGVEQSAGEMNWDLELSTYHPGLT